MNLQFEHNNFFRKELKEQKSFLGFMNKELDDMNKEFYGVNAQITRLENAIAKISDKQATLVNKMAAKPEKLHENNDEDLKVINVSPIRSMFFNMNFDDYGSDDESTLPRRRPKNSESFDLNAKFGKREIGESSTSNI